MVGDHRRLPLVTIAISATHHPATLNLLQWKMESTESSRLSLEDEPFLQDHHRSSHTVPEEEPDSRSTAFDVTQHSRSFICLFALKFCIQFTYGVLELPMIRLVERAICRAYLENVSDDYGEAACKVPVVQDKLAFIMSYKWTFDALPGSHQALRGKPYHH